MKRMRTTRYLALAIATMAVLVAGQFSPARAELAAVSTVVAPPGTTTVLLEFPNWYADKSGVGLAQCNFDGGGTDPNCIAGAPLPGFEAFYWAGDPPVGALDGGNASGVVMVMGIEAVPTATALPTTGVVFARIRIRADLVGPGVYTLTHPFGVETFTILTAGRRAINQTVDVPLPEIATPDFTGVLAGPIGPFLTCVNPAPPAGYLGNYGVPCTFTGSPFGQNLVRLQGPGTDNIATQLHISGKIEPTVTAPPLTLTSATYQCSAGSCLADIRATADPTALLTTTAAGVTANMVVDPLVVGGFKSSSMLIPQAQIPLPVDGLNTFPVQALVVANQPGFVGTMTTVEKRMSLVDTVTITQAVHNLTTGILTVTAKSGDPRATMSAAPFGAFKGNQLFFDLDGFGGVGIPAATVTVNSTGGGTATAATTTIRVPEKLKITRATFNARRRKLTVLGTSSAKGATIVLRSVTNPLGTGAVVNAKGGFKAVARVNRKPRFVRVISSGGKTARAFVQ